MYPKKLTQTALYLHLSDQANNNESSQGEGTSFKVYFLSINPLKAGEYKDIFSVVM